MVNKQSYSTGGKTLVFYDQFSFNPGHLIQYFESARRNSLAENQKQALITAGCDPERQQQQQQQQHISCYLSHENIQNNLKLYL